MDSINSVHQKKLSPLEKIALAITAHVGSMEFFLLILFWTLVWLGWNILAPQGYRFDPYPAFVLWLFISNLIQIHLMPLIMVGQNIQGKHAQLRAEHDFKTDQKAEKEIETILLRLETQEQLLQEIKKQLNTMTQKK
jgi:uncharacterized membrane protein